MFLTLNSIFSAPSRLNCKVFVLFIKLFSCSVLLFISFIQFFFPRFFLLLWKIPMYSPVSFLQIQQIEKLVTEKSHPFLNRICLDATNGRKRKHLHKWNVCTIIFSQKNKYFYFGWAAVILITSVNVGHLHNMTNTRRYLQKMWTFESTGMIIIRMVIIPSLFQ